MNDLIERLKALARAEHDDVSVAAEAAVMIEKLADGIDSLSMHGVRDIVPGWVCVPESEWDSAMQSLGYVLDSSSQDRMNELAI